MDLIRFARVIYNKKYFLILLLFVSLLSTYFFTKNTQNTYKSMSVISAGILDDSKISLEDDIDATSSYLIQTKFSNLIELMSSKSVIDLLSLNLLLKELTEIDGYESNTSLLRIIDILETKIDSIKILDLTVPEEYEIKKLIDQKNYDYESIKKKLKIERIGSSDYIQITFESNDPYKSAFTVNTLAKEFIKYYEKDLSDKNKYSVMFFTKLADEKKAELNLLVNYLKQYKLDNKIINLYEQTKSVVTQISDLEIIRENENKKIPAYSKALQDINAKFTDKENSISEYAASIYNKRIINIKNDINKISSERVISSENDKDKLAQLQNELNDEIEKYYNDMSINLNSSKKELVNKKVFYEIEIEIAKKSVESIDKELRRLYGIVESFAPSEASISSYEREISVAAESYLLILNKLNLARFASDNSGNTIRIHEHGYPADKPEPNKKLLLIILSGFISLILGIVIIFIHEYLDLSIKSPKRFFSLTNVQPLINLNEIDSNSIDISQLFNNPDYYSFEKNIRDVRHLISNKMKGDKVLSITSSKKGSGKTIFLTALAYSYKLIGKKVLIIDTNFKNNSLTKIFKSDQNIINILSTKSVNPISLNGIDIIGTELFHGSPAVLDSWKNMKDIL